MVEVELWIATEAWTTARGRVKVDAESSPDDRVAVQDAMELQFPVWTPGSYMLREYTRNIESITATKHGAQGGPSQGELPLERSGKNRWRIPAAEQAKFVCVAYRLYCREMSVRTNWVERDYGFLTGAATFPLVDGWFSAYEATAHAIESASV